MKMYQVKLKVTDEDKDLFTEKLFALGASGVSLVYGEDEKPAGITSLFEEIKEVNEEFSPSLASVTELEESIWRHR